MIPKNLSFRQDGLVPFLPVNHYEDKKSLLLDLGGKKWVAVSPGASYETKQAPVELLIESLEKFRHLLQNKEDSKNIGLLLLGDQKDAEICQQLKNGLKWPDIVLNYAGQLSLWENAIVLKKVVCLLSTDSALAHIAEAVDTPVLVLFGPTVEGFGFAPRKKESRAFSSRIGCRPCSKHGKAPCRFGDKLCFQQISREDIALYMRDLACGNQPLLNPPLE
jgi:ADP-heptose:LPS heptosyltransferase